MKFPTYIPFVETLGMELHRFENGEAEISLEVREDICNSWSVLHGGAVMTLLDVVMAHAAKSPVGGEVPSDLGVVTIEMKTTFMRPGLGRVLAKGRVVHRTASIAFCEASIYDAEGKITSQATGTFKYLKGLPAGGRKIHRQNASD